MAEDSAMVEERREEERRGKGMNQRARTREREAKWVMTVGLLCLVTGSLCSVWWWSSAMAEDSAMVEERREEERREFRHKISMVISKEAARNASIITNVMKGDQHDVREQTNENEVRNFGKPVDLARQYYKDWADEVFLYLEVLRAIWIVKSFVIFLMRPIKLLKCLYWQAIKVLMNLTNDNPVGCQKIAAYGGLETCLHLLLATFHHSIHLCLPSVI